MAGTKTITNNSGVPIVVVLRGRVGADPSGGSLPPVSAVIAAHESKTLAYGTNENPYLNSLQVEEGSNGSAVTETYTCLTRGGPGTLDNLFNANSTITVTYTPSTYSFGISASN